MGMDRNGRINYSPLKTGRHVPQGLLCADGDANNFVLSKNRMIMWASIATQAVINHGKCRSSELKCTDMLGGRARLLLVMSKHCSSRLCTLDARLQS